MKTQALIYFGLLLIGISTFSFASPKADFYLSPHGSDEWSGTLAAPNPENTDGPFASLERARNAVRTLKGNTSKDIVVLVREGKYTITKTVVFGLEDSASADSSITYAAYPGETPVFSSGKDINAWSKVNGTLEGLPKAAQGKVWVADVSDKFLTLYDEQGMLPRARSEALKPLAGGNKTKLHFPRGRLKNWPNITDIEILVRPTRAWIMNVLPLAKVDEKKSIAHTSIPATYGMVKKNFWIENAIEELDEAGEWVLNTQTGKVYLWPRNNSDLTKSQVTAPQLIEFIRIEGQIDKQGPLDIPVRNLHFRGLTFKHSERFTLAQNDKGLQHDWDMHDNANAVFRLRGTEGCVLANNHFLHSGSSAIRVDLHGQFNEITGNHIEHMGGAGILLSGYGPGTKDVNKFNLVSNNHIHHIGKIYWHSPGIFINQSGDNRVSNNLIHHTNYIGLNISGLVTRFFVKQNKRESSRTIRWHEIANKPSKNPTLDELRPYLHTRNNLVELNEIHHVMQILGDGNGIYIRGSGPGNVIRRNYIHHLVAPINAQSAIRTDGGQMDTLIAENVMYLTKSQGMTLKLNNRFENNVIADVIAPRGIYLKIVEGPMKGASNKRNIFYSTNPDCAFISQPGGGKERKFGEDSRGREIARMQDVDSDYNIYYCKQDPSMAEKVLSQLQSKGTDEHSRIIDPMFVDPENEDFRLKAGSPALDMGIIPIDLSKIGLLKPPPT